MENENKFEIQYRELLIRRLNYLLVKLNKEVDSEINGRIARQDDIRSKYPDEEAAHEAFGWGYITEDEYLQIAGQLDSVNDPTTLSAARDELRDFIARLKREIKNFKWSMLSDKEKDDIQKSNEALKDRIQKIAKEMRTE